MTQTALASCFKGFIVIRICLEDRDVFARFEEIPSITLYDINETVYTNAIPNYKGKYLQ